MILDGLSYKYLIEGNLKDKKTIMNLQIENQKNSISQINSKKKDEKERKLILTTNSPIRRMIVYSNATRVLIKRAKNLKKKSP